MVTCNEWWIMDAGCRFIGPGHSSWIIMHPLLITVVLSKHGCWVSTGPAKMHEWLRLHADNLYHMPPRKSWPAALTGYSFLVVISCRLTSLAWRSYRSIRCAAVHPTTWYARYLVFTWYSGTLTPSQTDRRARPLNKQEHKNAAQWPSPSRFAYDGRIYFFYFIRKLYNESFEVYYFKY